MYRIDFKLLVFLIFGLTAIYIAYTDTFSSEKLSIKEAIISFIIGTLFAIY